MAFSGFQKTRLGLAAFARGLYGSFAGKAEKVVSFGPGAGYSTNMTNNGIGKVGIITNDGIGKTGEI